MSWWLIAALSVTAFGFKAVGMVVIGDRQLPPVTQRCVALIPPAMLAAIVLHDTFAVGQSLTIDARVVGVGVAAIAAWRRAPLIVVIVLAALVTAAVRAFS
jgi:branched-subunit amino acid transport protein